MSEETHDGEKLKKREPRNRKHLPLKILLLFIILAVLLFGIGFAALCIAEEKYRSDTDYSKGIAIVTLGSQVYPDGQPSPNLRYRLETTLEAWNALQRMIVVCGGRGDDEPVEEARAMRDWLVEHGVPEDQILVEDTSLDTMQNIANAKALLEAAGIDTSSVLIVTSDFHVPRSVAIAEHMGFNEAYGASAYTRPEYWLKYHVREVLAWVKWELYVTLGWKINMTWK